MAAAGTGTSGTPGSSTERVAAFVTGYDGAAAPADVDAHAARAFANWYACTLGGSSDDSARRFFAVLERTAGRGEASVLGRGVKLDMANAAFANGCAANALDFDDMHVPTLIHPTGPVVAAALAAAEARGASGRALLDAIVVGIEVELHMGECLFPDHYDAGWHITATAGVIGAAAAASRLLGLDEQKTAFALGLAATQAGGLRAMLPNEGKDLNVGRAAYGGVLAALLAEAGVSSAPAVLDETFGYFDVFKPRESWRRSVGDLGQRFLIGGMSLKPYPCGVVIHPVIDACAAISRRAGFDAGAVQGLEIVVHPRTAVLAAKQDPASAITSRFSLHHAAALALTRGAADFEAFETADVADPALAALRRRMAVREDRDMPQTQARVIATLADGARIEEHVTKATGGPDNPLTTAQLRTKFVQLCRLATDTATAERLFGLCLGVADQDDLSALCAP